MVVFAFKFPDAERLRPGDRVSLRVYAVGGLGVVVGDSESVGIGVSVGGAVGLPDSGGVDPLRELKSA
jgi:protein involved in polysaccharide export with SLBB domain